MILAVGRVRLTLNHSLNTFSLALKRRLIVAPLKLLTGRLAQVFATGFAWGDGGRLNGLNRAGVAAADTVVLIPLAVGAWVVAVSSLGVCDDGLLELVLFFGVPGKSLRNQPSLGHPAGDRGSDPGSKLSRSRSA